LSLLAGVSSSKAGLPLEVSILTTSSSNLHVLVQIRISTIPLFVWESSADRSALFFQVQACLLCCPGRLDQGVAIILQFSRPRFNKLVSPLSLKSQQLSINLFRACSLGYATQTCAFCLFIYSPVLYTEINFYS
jgi:hypothetical protein